MEVLSLQALPNQSFSVILDGNQWNISVRDTNGTISFTLVKNGVIVVENARAVAGMRIIPSIYQEDGNFALICLNQAIPDYAQFGVTQSLVYISPTELVAMRVPIPAQITADYFDPLGGLPLRFAPQGYILAQWLAIYAPHARLVVVGRTKHSASYAMAAHGSLSARGTTTTGSQGFFTMPARGSMAFIGRSSARGVSTSIPKAALAPIGRSLAASHATWSPHTTLAAHH